MTGKVSRLSPIRRKKWLHQGMVQAASQSFWNGMTGTTKDAVVYLAKNESAEHGHVVTFDFTGNLTGVVVKDREVAYGKGEQKRIFSDGITVERFRMPVNNGDKFDQVDIDNLNIGQHQNSRQLLADLIVRWQDQSLFDTGQGLLGQTPTHVIDLGSTFSYNDLLDMINTVKTSKGFTTGSIRRPLDAYRETNQMPCWLLVVDSAMATVLKKDPNYQTLVFNADVRGNGNRAIKMIIGKIGNLMIMETSQFFGATRKSGTFGLNDSQIELSGLRQRDGNNVWTGQPGFTYEGDLYSRGLLLGSGAFQKAFGKQPDYMWQPSQDFGITSESAVELWYGVKKTKLATENSDDYVQALIAGIDYGVVAVDLKVQ